MRGLRPRWHEAEVEDTVKVAGRCRRSLLVDRHALSSCRHNFGSPSIPWSVVVAVHASKEVLFCVGPWRGGGGEREMRMSWIVE